MKTLLPASLRHLLAVLTLLALLAITGLPAHAQDTVLSPQVHDVGDRSDRVLVGVVQGAARADVAAALSADGLVLGRYWPQFGIAEALIPPDLGVASDFLGESSDIMAARSGLVRYIVADSRVVAAVPEPPLLEQNPNDPYFSQQWALAKIQAVKAWNITYGDPDVVIAVIDSGYDPNHTDLAASALWTNRVEADGKPGVDDDANGYIDDINGWDWVEDDNAPHDLYGHGMHVLGTVAATAGNSKGIAGAGRSLRVAPLRMLDGPYGDISDLVDAVAYAIDMDMSIINLSLTGGHSPAMHDAVEAASAAGLIVVAAAGNSAAAVEYPAAYPETVAVAATDAGDMRASFSSFGPEVTVAAPGVDILSLYPTDDYARSSGTSMATPHVAALLGLLRSLRPDLSAAELVALITSTATDVNAAVYPGDDVYLGAGRIDLYAALLAASGALELRTEPAAFDTVTAGQPLDVNARVTASSLAVEGAVVSLRVLKAEDAGAASPVMTLRHVTGKTGVGAFSFTAPSEPGDYVLRFQVGSSVRTVPIRVAEAFRIRVDLADAQLTVGGETSPFTITVRGPDGHRVTEPLPTHIETSRGFVNGQRELDVIIADGVFTGTLRSGNLAGSGTLSATIELATGAAGFDFVAGPPASIAFGASPDRIVTDLDNTIITLSVFLFDEYGNPADSVTGVSFTAGAGTIWPATSATAGGTAVTTVTVPRTLTTPVRVEADVPGHQELSAETEVLTVPPLIWLPFSRVDRVPPK